MLRTGLGVKQTRWAGVESGLGHQCDDAGAAQRRCARLLVHPENWQGAGVHPLTAAGAARAHLIVCGLRQNVLSRDGAWASVPVACHAWAFDKPAPAPLLRTTMIRK